MPYIPLWFTSFMVFDILVIVYFLFLFIKISNTTVFCNILIGLVYNLYIGQIHEMLKQILYRRGASRIGAIDIFKLRFILHEHSRVCVYLLQCDQLWSKFLFAFVPIQMLTMIALASHLMLDSIPDDKFVFYVLVFLLYVFGLSLVLILLSLVSAVLHKAAKHLSSIQILLPPANISLKLKYLNFFERLTSQTRYGMKIGSISTITFSTSGQVGLVWLSNKHKNNSIYFIIVDFNSIYSQSSYFHNFKTKQQCFCFLNKRYFARTSTKN